MAEAACEGLELGLVARLSPEHREAAFRALEGWQEANHIGDSLGPYTGAGVQWTQYAVGHLGYYWALLSALFAEVPHAAGWCASQPLKLVEALHPSIERALLALWVMHALPNDLQYQTSYQAAAEAVREVGGIAASWIARPSPANPDPEFAEDEEWTALAPRDATALVPTAAELRELVRVSGVSQADPVDLSLKALLDDPADRPADGGALVAYLARQ